MSLQSCQRCGYAVAIEGGGCRHCSSTSEAAPTSWRDPKLFLPLGSVAIAVATALYLILS